MAALVVGALALGLTAGVTAATAAPPGDEPGVTMRAYQLGQPISELCTLKAAQTPNVDELKQTIDWDAPDEFGGLQDNYLVEVLANLEITTADTYEFRLVSDDGSELLIDDEIVIDHDGLHGATAKDGSVTLSEGVHPLRINYFEATNGEQLTLSWRRSGEADFTVVPSSVLSTEADVTRVTAPGFKQCEGQTDSAGDGLQLDAVNPAYDLVDLRPDGFEPQVTGLEWMGDDLLVLTWGGNGNDQGNVELGELWRLEGVKDAADPSDVTHTKIAEGLKEPQGIKVVRARSSSPRRTSSRSSSTATATASTRAGTPSPPGPSTATSTSSPSACSTGTASSTSTCRSRSTSAARPPCRRARPTAARTSPSTRSPVRSSTSPADSARRTAWARARTARST